MLWIGSSGTLAHIFYSFIINFNLKGMFNHCIRKTVLGNVSSLL